jgi:tRNA A-37 threonylcarbamoyl transferase component Bud32
MIPTRRCAHLFHGEKIWYARGWQAALEKIGIAKGNNWARLSPGQFISGGSPITNCYRVELDNGEVGYFKRYVYDKPRPQFWMLPSKAAVEVFGYDFMHRHGMEVPEVVAYGEQRHRGTLFAAFIVTKEIPDTINLTEFARDQWFGMREPERSATYKQISERLCAQVKAMHAAGFFHHDLKWKNILLRHDAAGWHPIWIDCPRAARIRLRKRRSVIIDLGRLGRLAGQYLSVKQQLRWLHAYLGPQARKKDVKKLYSEVKDYLDRRRPPHDYELPEVK